MKIIVLLLLSSAVYAQGSTENIKVVRDIFSAFNEHDWQKMMSYYADNATFQDPSFKEIVSDKNFMLSHHQEMHAVFPDIHDEVKQMYQSGESVIVEFVASGTSSNGEKFLLPICTVFTFSNGKVTRDATYYDMQD